jgi:hypothetical protein
MNTNAPSAVCTVRKKRADQLLKTLCVLLPATAMTGAHWFPWKRHLGRDLNNLERYIIGTAAIVGTANLAISQSEGDRDDHVVMLLLSAISAGLTTLAAYAIDRDAKLRAECANLAAQMQVVKGESNAKQSGL